MVIANKRDRNHINALLIHIRKTKLKTEGPA
jgi:hypothetical protein